ncbi:MAG: hypothetical protein GAK28_00568 [Luteibacter sp.]|uniref:hypothetical protein n=1 Tax=Luteibacter sp. TaxID=1886636 RepID=UPI001382C2B3|nr:hypothetical protein [Luteibacter sp.]KAF1008936.1 MAG: hypothetical protein GAK28_00568 [Luteibacter sp.]
MTASLNIGLTAYHAVGNLAFVKVPSERGRYMLTDLCVIAVACAECGAVIGEPCRAYHGLTYWEKRFPDKKPSGHTVTVHYKRKHAADEKLGRGWKKTVLAHYRLRLAAGDIEAAMAHLPDSEPEPAPIDIDVPVTRRTEG